MSMIKRAYTCEMATFTTFEAIYIQDMFLFCSTNLWRPSSFCGCKGKDSHFWTLIPTQSDNVISQSIEKNNVNGLVNFN